VSRELVIAAGPGEWRAALVEDGVVADLFVERGQGFEIGSHYLGRVIRLLPALGAVLVDLGGERPAFLSHDDIAPRGRRLDEGERVIVRIRREAQGGKPPRLGLAAISDAALAERAARLDPPARLTPAATVATALAGAAGPVERIRADDPAAIPELRAAFPASDIAAEPDAPERIGLDAAFEQALSPSIAIPGGGTAHFEATRAAVLIDIDSGTPETGSPERTALAVNLAAAILLAREIRRRSLGGAIVVDFVGLDRPESRERVRKALAIALKPDPVLPQILGWTRLGHLELVRPRRRRPLAETLLEPTGEGALRKTAATIAYDALRRLRDQARHPPGSGLRLLAAPEIGAALAGPAAGALSALEARLARRIDITIESDRPRDRFEIVPG
jgi:Ribonuclease G/E